MIHPRNMVLAIVGDVDTQTVRRLVTKHLRWVPTPAPRLPTYPRPAVRRPLTVELRRKEKQQAHIVYGVLAAPLASPDYYPLLVLNAILAGQGGRLFAKLRDELSLAYAVSASFQAGIDPGFFMVYLGTEPSKIATAVAGIRAELERVAVEGIEAAEFERVRQYLVGTYELDRQRNAGNAASYAFNVLYGFGLHEVERYPAKILQVTRADCVRVAAKYLRAERAVTAIVRPG